MLDNFEDVLKIELDDDDDDFPNALNTLNQTFIRSESPVNLNGTTNLFRSNINAIKQPAFIGTHNQLPMVQIEPPCAKHWMEEIVDFSKIVAQQTQIVLNRIKIDFLRSGMKFDSDFRDHFLLIANNR